MNYVIGIDGGGTKTHLKALDLRQKVVGEAWGGASNLTALSTETVQENLRLLITEFYEQTGLSPKDCVSVCLGTAGASSNTSQQELSAILADLFPGIPTLLTNDALPILYSGTPTGCGIVLIAGTGSVCMARDLEGNLWRVGGWGHLIGDEGSGYHIACRMLSAVMRAYDGRGRQTVLTELLLRHLGLSSPMDLIDYIYQSGNGKKELASLAVLCDEAFALGDPAAKRIYEEAADSLFEMVATAAQKLSSDRSPVICVCAGSMVTKSLPLRNILYQRLQEKVPDIVLQECRQDAAYGCALMALEKWNKREPT